MPRPNNECQIIDRNVGTRLRTRRIMMKMSQEKLADHVNLTFQQIQKYEKGTNRISASRLVQFSRLLEIPISFFFEDIIEGKANGNASYVDDFVRSTDGIAVAKAFAKLTPTARRKVADLIATMARHKEVKHD